MSWICGPLRTFCTSVPFSLFPHYLLKISCCFLERVHHNALMCLYREGEKNSCFNPFSASLIQESHCVKTHVYTCVFRLTHAPLSLPQCNEKYCSVNQEACSATNQSNWFAYSIPDWIVLNTILPNENTVEIRHWHTQLETPLHSHLRMFHKV